jgi:short-subunit dehydrogenase
MLPLLRTGQRRVVTIGSAASWTTMPFAGVQCSAKHALRSLNDALRPGAPRDP